MSPVATGTAGSRGCDEAAGLSGKRIPCPLWCLGPSLLLAAGSGLPPPPHTGQFCEVSWAGVCHGPEPLPIHLGHQRLSLQGNSSGPEGARGAGDAPVPQSRGLWGPLASCSPRCFLAARAPATGVAVPQPAEQHLPSSSECWLCPLALQLPAHTPGRGRPDGLSPRTHRKAQSIWLLALTRSTLGCRGHLGGSVDERLFLSLLCLIK